MYIHKYVYIYMHVYYIVANESTKSKDQEEILSNFEEFSEDDSNSSLEDFSNNSTYKEDIQEHSKCRNTGIILTISYFYIDRKVICKTYIFYCYFYCFNYIHLYRGFQ